MEPVLRGALRGCVVVGGLGVLLIWGLIRGPGGAGVGTRARPRVVPWALSPVREGGVWALPLVKKNSEWGLGEGTGSLSTWFHK